MMLTQEEYDGLELMFELGIAPTVGKNRDAELAEVERLVEERLAKARTDPAKWAQDNAKETKRRFGSRVVKLILNHHPAARGLTREDKDLVRSIAVGKADIPFKLNADGSVGITPEDAKKWHVRIERILPVLKVIATFTPVPYNFGVIGLIVILVLIDENRLKPYIVEGILYSFRAAA